MPLYEYECKQCKQRFEKIQSFSDPEEKVCPKCGGEVERVITAPAVQFKGSGWYVTDYARKSGVGTAGKSESSESSTSSNSSDSKSSESKSTESKPASSSSNENK